MGENQTGKPLQIDSGMEYINDLLVKVCQLNCIISTHGLIERMNRTLLKKVRCMLSNAGLSKTFWAKVVAYASHLINQLTSAVIKDKTPIEVWYRKPANDYDFYMYSASLPIIM